MKTASTTSEPASPLPSPLNRRSFLAAAATVAGASIATKTLGVERDWSGRNPTRFPDPDIIALDPRFKKYAIGNTPIQRLYHSPDMMWAEGPAWNAVGRYLLWSDIPNNRQLRWLEEDGHVSTFRQPAGNSNGNTFDFEGRELSCEHLTRRVVRYEHNGTITVLADKFGGKSFNAPNDIVVHPNGDIWFTDPGYGGLMNYEGRRAEGTSVQPYQKEAVYRIDAKTFQIEKVTDEAFKPNGICFSPDYKKLYIADTGASHYPEAPKNIWVFDVVNEKKLANRKEFCSMKATIIGGHIRTDEEVRRSKAEGKLFPLPSRPEAAGFADGIRADVDGNIWVGAGWVGDGYDGVHCFAPDGQRIGQILLPEICANICFGGTKRNRLFMAASTSLYAVYVETQGAHIT